MASGSDQIAMEMMVASALEMGSDLESRPECAQVQQGVVGPLAPVPLPAHCEEWRLFPAVVLQDHTTVLFLEVAEILAVACLFELRPLRV